ncbi:MAG: hypothetical protein ACK4NP_00960 [Parvularculaceae bacterium]
MRARAFALLATGLAAAGCATTAGSPASPAAGAKSVGKPAFRAADFENATAAEIDMRLGAPALTRTEGAGEFRRYTLARCALMIILYPDDKGERRAASLAAGALVSGEEPPKLDECLAAGKAN